MGCRIELILGPRNFCCLPPRDIFDSYYQYTISEIPTNLYARRRRLVIHLTPDSFGKNRTNEYPIDFLVALDNINLASSYSSALVSVGGP
jgi:hypothetical protein